MRAILLTIVLITAGIDRALGQDCEPVPSDWFSGSPNRAVYALFWNDGEAGVPPGLYAGGSFFSAGGQSARCFAHWNGQVWSPLGDPANVSGSPAMSFSVFDDDGPGPEQPALIIGGQFSVLIGGETVNDLVRWNGLSLSRVGSGLETRAIGTTYAWDADGPGPIQTVLVIYGTQVRVNGVTARWVAKWDGENWTSMPLPDSWTYTEDFYGGSFVEYDPDGSGPAMRQLHLGGGFREIASPYGTAARWTGSAWEMLGGGLSGGFSPFVNFLRVFDEDGEGPMHPSLFASGYFHELANGTEVPGIARWNGSEWSAIPSAPIPDKLALETFDPDAEGPAPESLYLADTSGNFYRYDGTLWTHLGRVFGGQGDVYSTTVSRFADVPTMFIGGLFDSAFGIDSPNLIAYTGCSCVGDLDADGVVSIQDLAILLAHFADPAATPEVGDLDADSDVDLQDLATLLSRFGVQC